jgi:hypothetical protein
MTLLSPRSPLSRLAAVVGIMLAGLLVATEPTSAADGSQPAAAIPRGRLAIGDSVMLGAAEELRARGFRVDAVVSRQFSTAPSLVRSYRAQGRLPRHLVIGLGTNGNLTPDMCRQTVRAARHRAVFFVNLRVPRSWQASNNRLLHACAHHFRRAHLIDWHRRSSGHPGWFASDGYHLTPVGQRQYARFVDAKVSALS